MSKELWVYSESVSIEGELVSAMGEIASNLGARLYAIELDELREEVYSERKLLIKSDKRISDSYELASEALASIASKRAPSIIAIGATRFGRILASLLSAKLRVTCLADVFNLRLDSSKLITDRSVLAGRAVATISSNLPCIVTVRSGMYPRYRGSVETVEEEFVYGMEQKIVRIDRKEREKSKADLKSANVIVSIGRGIKRKEDIAMIEELTNLLGGVVGCSRPISSDYGWLPEDRHIGLTGVNVKPDLYIAVGISGQLQHLAGIKDSKIIVAINIDKDAPIFQACDYGIVGDLYKVVPAMVRILRERATS